MSQSQQDWYSEMCDNIRNEGRSKCCNAPLEDDGSCFDGCCDRWKCTRCGRSYLVEVGD